MVEKRYAARAARLAPAGRAVADETRLRILLRLVERSTTVSELSAVLDVPQPRVSSHLRVLTDAGLVRVQPTGRLRRYELDVDRAEPLLSGLHYAAGAEGSDGGSAPEPDSALRTARRCYDHVAGIVGVQLLDTLLRRKWLIPEKGWSPQSRYQVSAAGERALRRLDLEPFAGESRRLLAFGCTDWTETRPHLGGALAGQLTAALQRDRVITISPENRTIAVHAPVENWLVNHL